MQVQSFFVGKTKSLDIRVSHAKKCHIFVHFEKGQFSDKNVICVEMSIRIAKILKILRVTIYMATFETKLIEIN